MIKELVLFVLEVLSISLQSSSFKEQQPISFREQQQRFQRVRQAYTDKENNMMRLLDTARIERERLNIYLRAFKTEKQIELWGKNDTDEEFRLITNYEICSLSGDLGPKRRQGDFQIPEGFYHISRFNPVSSYYLSLKVNYPNPSDRILGGQPLGGDIFVHGACVTIGCLPITDELIKELYIFCVEARNNGQTFILITIFPLRLTDENFGNLVSQYPEDSPVVGLWTDLKRGYEIFNETHQLPRIGFLNSGRHQVSE